MLDPNFKRFIKNCKCNRGFSLVELMVVMVIVGILATGVVFMFADPTAKVKAAAFNMLGDLNRARSEAVSRNEDVLVEFLNDVSEDCQSDIGVSPLDPHQAPTLRSTNSAMSMTGSLWVFWRLSSVER